MFIGIGIGIGICHICKNYRCPDKSEQYKSAGMGYSNLLHRQANVAPWNEVCVDLIDPWKINIISDKEYVVNALPCINHVTNIVELFHINK